MSTFVQRAACRGHRPTSVCVRRHQSRPHLVAQLLREREAPRFVVAPAGFGKSTLVYEYAEVMFDFNHVFWFGALSPCFLRDIDAGRLCDDIVAADERCALAVFEDVPLLEGERLAAFSRAIDGLLAHGCEVVVTTTPSRDCLGPLQRDRLLIGAVDLLLDDEEAARNGRGEPTGARPPFSAEERIPCLQWGDEGWDVLLAGCAGEELPADMLLVMWMILALGQGSWHDMETLLGEQRALEAWDVLAPRFPFLGMSEGTGRFSAVRADPTVLATRFDRLLDGIVAASGLGGRDELARHGADLLLRRGDARRAARLMGAFASREAVVPWLVERGWDVLWGRAAAEFCELFEWVARMRIEERPLLYAMMAWASAQVRDARRSLDYAKRALGAPEPAAAAFATAALCGRVQGNATMAKRMARLLGSWEREKDGGGEPPQEGPRGSQEGGLPRESLEECPDLAVLVRVSLAQEHPETLLRVWSDAREERGPFAFASGNEAEPWLLAAAWVIEGLVGGSGDVPSEESLEDSYRLDALAAWCCDAIDDRLARGLPLGFGSLRAAEALDGFEEALVARRARTLLPGAVAAMRLAHVEAAHGREAYEDLRRRRQAAASLGSVAPVNERARQGLAQEWRTKASVTLGAPLLDVRLFGSLSVHVGDREVSPRSLAHRSIRLLLALLVVNRGRDLTREALASALFPATRMESAVKSFYRVWHDLARLLTVEEACPYLVRDRYGCRLDPTLFVSDVMEFEELTRHLLFGDAPSTVSWESLYQLVKGPFSGELLPIEQESEVICALRDRLAIEMVDGLIAASRRLRGAGEPQGALWFAREALARDETREDAYVVLMEAQMASGQRTAALATFFDCRASLAERLGLDPSAQMLALYQQLIEDDPVLESALR